MTIDEQVRARVEELIMRGDELASQRPQWATPGGPEAIYESEGWIASASNALEVVFPNPLSPHRSRASVVAMQSTLWQRVGGIAAVLKAMLVDIDAGVIRTHFLVEGARCTWRARAHVRTHTCGCRSGGNGVPKDVVI